jgi:tetratricopeptide (TPR) repeat protein
MRLSIWILMVAPAAWAQQIQLRSAVDAHNRGDQAAAIGFFEAAVRLGPDSVPLRLHLGSAYLRRVGSEQNFAANMRMAGLALEQFRQALNRNPTDRLAMFQTACAFYFTGNLEESKRWFRRLVQRSGADADALVALGYTNLSEVSRRQFPAQVPATGLLVPVTDPVVRLALRTKWLPGLEEAQQALNTAAGLNSNDEDALGFLNHLLLRKAELADTPVEYQSLKQQADVWKQRAAAAKGKGTRPHGVSVLLDAILPPPALAFVPRLP